MLVANCGKFIEKRFLFFCKNTQNPHTERISTKSFSITLILHDQKVAAAEVGLVEAAEHAEAAVLHAVPDVLRGDE